LSARELRASPEVGPLARWEACEMADLTEDVIDTSPEGLREQPLRGEDDRPPADRARRLRDRMPGA
jgi:hypothetical protein